MRRNEIATRVAVSTLARDGFPAVKPNQDMARPLTRSFPITLATIRQELPYKVYSERFDLLDRVLDRLPDLDVYLVQDQRGGEKICAYLSIRDYPMAKVINFTCHENAKGVRFEFVYGSFLSPETRDKLSNHAATSAMKIFNLRPERFEVCMAYADEYLAAIVPAVHDNRVKFGTEIERWTRQALDTFYFDQIDAQSCPDEIKVRIGHRRKFDFYLPAIRVAIEVDGSHHFKQRHNGKLLEEVQQDDEQKNAACAEAGIGMVRVIGGDGSNSIYGNQAVFAEKLRLAVARAAGSGESVRLP